MKGMGNMGNMMKQMQQMQKKMMKAQDELHEMSFEASVGGGMVTVTANGKKEITDVQINEEVVDPDDIEMLQDLILRSEERRVGKESSYGGARERGKERE